MAGRTLDATALRTAGSIKLANVAQRALRLHTTSQLATKLRGKLDELWRGPPCLTAQNPRPWWGSIFSSELSIPATGAEWNKLIQEVAEMLMFSPADLGEVQLGRPQLISEILNPTPMIGKLWRAARAVADRAARHTRSAPQWPVADTSGAFNLADALSGDPVNHSEIGREAAASGHSASDSTNVGPPE